MLNILWAFMMLTGILWAAFHGNLDLVTNGALESAGEAVKLCITMLGVMSFWTGILEVGRRAGLIEQLAGKMDPILNVLFPRLPKGHPARQSIAANMIANMLGLGWAATPAGLQAMEELERLEEERREEDRRAENRPAEDRRGRMGSRWTVGDGRGQPDRGGGIARPRGKGLRSVPRGTANSEMCTFLVINISSLQLIPINMIAYRTQYASADPMAVIGPALIATSISTLVGVIFCKAMNGRNGGEAGYGP